ncbi:hypothetical protein AMK11_23260 [Streptomyces sp. CB02414]|nr:hypothetical protein AMK11_23260 [Streptomyces sp. CB02414]
MANSGAKAMPHTVCAAPLDRYVWLSTVTATTSCHSATRTRMPDAAQATAVRAAGRRGRHRSLTSSSGSSAASSARTDRPTTYAMPQPGMS